MRAEKGPAVVAVQAERGRFTQAKTEETWERLTKEEARM